MNKDIETTINNNSFQIKLNFGETLYKYLKYVRPQETDNLLQFRRKLDSLDENYDLANFALDNVISQMRNLLVYVSPGPPVNIDPSSSSVTTANLIFSSDDDFDMIRMYIANLINNETLRPLTYQALIELHQNLQNKTKLYADDFLVDIKLDAADCDNNPLLQKFLATFRNYGVADCIDSNNLRYYVELLKSEDLSTLPPTIAEAINVIILNINSPVKIQVTLDQQEYLSLTGSKNNNIRALFNRYNELTPIRFTNKKDPAEPEKRPLKRKTAEETSTQKADVHVLIETTTDDDDDDIYDRETIVKSGAESVISTTNSSTQRRKRRRKKIKKSSVSSSLSSINQISESQNSSQNDREISYYNTLPPTTGSTNIQTNIFIDNVKQTTKPILALPQLFQYIIQIISKNVDDSMLTCPSAYLNTVIGAENYLNKLETIQNMNLSTVDNRVHFYELLRPLALYSVNDKDIANSIWFITVAGSYFEKSAEHFNNIRLSLIDHSNNSRRNNMGVVLDDPDRVALFIIKYNFLWHYRQFISKLVSSYIKAFGDERILKVLRVYDMSVRTKFESIPIKFNHNKVYRGPIADIVKLMNAQFAELV